MKHTKEYLERRAAREKATLQRWRKETWKRMIPNLVLISFVAVVLVILDIRMAPFALLSQSEEYIGKCTDIETEVAYGFVRYHSIKKFRKVFVFDNGGRYSIHADGYGNFRIDEFEQASTEGKTFVAKYYYAHLKNEYILSEMRDTEGYIYISNWEINRSIVAIWCIFGGVELLLLGGYVYFKYLVVYDRILEEEGVDRTPRFTKRY